jgi:hypothetical protein
MENLNIKGSLGDYFIPEIDFNAQTGILEISGESYLEDTEKFYAPVIKWIEDFLDETDLDITMNIKLTYFNTSSSKSILEILELLADYKEQGSNVIVKWYYEKNDYEDIKEEVEDFMIDTGINIDLVPME